VSDHTQKFQGLPHLRERREQMGLSQHELARLCGFGLTQISRYETGQQEPSLSALLKLADVLGVSLDYLIGKSNDPHGQITVSDLNIYEREVLETFRRAGWAGIAHLGVDRLSK
jgi:transcriptional regulator with XRE-family HTH domain